MECLLCEEWERACGCFIQDLNFLLWSQLPAGATSVPWQGPGYSFVAIRASSDVRTWSLGRARLPYQRPPSRGHGPDFSHVVPRSLLATCCLSAPLKGGWAGTFVGFWPFVLSFPEGGKGQGMFTMLLENPKADSGLNLKVAALMCRVTSSKRSRLCTFHLVCALPQPTSELPSSAPACSNCLNLICGYVPWSCALLFLVAGGLQVVCRPGLHLGPRR